MSGMFERMTVDERLILWPTSTARFLAGIEPLNRGDESVWLCGDVRDKLDRGSWTRARELAAAMAPDQSRPDPLLDRATLHELPAAAWCLEHLDGLRCYACSAVHLEEHDPVHNRTCPECGHIGSDVEAVVTVIAVRPAAYPAIVLAVACVDDGLCAECRSRQ